MFVVDGCWLLLVDVACCSRCLLLVVVVCLPLLCVAVECFVDDVGANRRQLLFAAVCCLIAVVCWFC